MFIIKIWKIYKNKNWKKLIVKDRLQTPGHRMLLKGRYASKIVSLAKTKFNFRDKATTVSYECHFLRIRTLTPFVTVTFVISRDIMTVESRIRIDQSLWLSKCRCGTKRKLISCYRAYGLTLASPPITERPVRGLICQYRRAIIQ